MIDKTVQFIMGFKRMVGEFSMNLYYDDKANSEKSYVVKVQFENDKTEYFRSDSFESSLGDAFEYFMGIIENEY